MHYRHALTEVLGELARFALGKRRSPRDEEVPAILAPAPRLLTAPLQAAQKAAVLEAMASDPILGTHTVAYVTIDGALLWLRPVRAFDTVVATLPYGSRVTALRHEGRFTHVTWGEGSGWVEKDVLTYSEADIFPRFTDGDVYDAYHTVTRQVRALTKDSFAAQDLYLPLQSVEYVAYVLWQQKRAVPWPPVRPRLAGAWHEHLRGVRGVHVGLQPRTGAIIECGNTDDAGYVGYVEAVHPDETIDIAGIGRTGEGVFERAQIGGDSYREWRALFITLT